MDVKKKSFFLFKKLSRLLTGLGIPKIPVFLHIYQTITQMFGITLVECEGVKMYISLHDQGITPELLQKGTYAKCGTDLITKIIKPGMTAVDIGANFGYYTLIIAKHIGDHGRVYAFEPEPKNFRLLIKNVEINRYKNVIAINKAVFNKNKTARLFLDKNDLGRHSLSENNVGNKAGCIKVEGVTLDSFMESVTSGNRIDFIKIDVQGAEGLVLEGAQKILRRNNLKIFMEMDKTGMKSFSTDPLYVLKMLQKYNYKIKIIDYMSQCVRDATPEEVLEHSDKISTDLLFEKDKTI